MKPSLEPDRFAQYINPQVDKSYSIRARLTNRITIPEFIHIGRVDAHEPWGFIEHPQDCIEYHHVVRGGMRTWIDREEITVAPGRFYFVEPGQLHREESLESSVEFYYLKFNLLDLRGDQIPVRSEGPIGAPGQVLPPDDGTLASLFQKIFTEAANGSAGSQEIIEAHVLTLFWETRRRIGALGETQRVVPTRQAEIVTKAQKYLEDHLGSPFSLEEVAAHCAVSADYLSRLFKDSTGLSPSQFSARVKVEVAKEWLAGSSKSVREIAFALGFQDEHYFSRRFKAFEQMSPTEFRRAVDD